MEIDILFADADESLREIYCDYFARKGLTIETARDDLECAIKMRELSPHFLIIDLELFDDDAAVMSSSSLLLDDVPVTIVTGDESPSRLSEQSGVPVSYCFQKPYSFMALLERMRAPVSRKSVVVPPESSCL